ncbi:Hypothetical Protein RSKD131_4504 (plasmid) [Cereibacter sphaeroides KD131]|nr:Hypothetical Protein RSKD131_4504 [Cereibacter sphaeroides KD131]
MRPEGGGVEVALTLGQESKAAGSLAAFEVGKREFAAGDEVKFAITDKVDARTLARLHAAGFLPEVWAADDATQNLRRLVSERAGLVRSIRRVKSRV